MGALHEGHVTLNEKAREQNDVVVSSIFVNPTQFNNTKDYDHYPVTTTADIERLEAARCDALFLPSVQEIYPDGFDRLPTFNFGYLDTLFEAKHRPGHFSGVGQVVTQLLNIVIPTRLYLGQKDYQQCLIITDLVKQMGWANRLQIVICPTLREDDGLAMSSRNRRLSEAQRSVAVCLYQCLVSIKSKQNNTAFSIVQKECLDLLTAKGFRAEYVELANALTLEPLQTYSNAVPMVALIAANLGEVRLIDNMLLQ